MNPAYSITFRGVDLRVEFNDDESMSCIQVEHGCDITPLLSEWVLDDIHSEVMDSVDLEDS